MTVDLAELDAHEQPADDLRAKWKYYTKADKVGEHRNGVIIENPEEHEDLRQVGEVGAAQLEEAYKHLDIAPSQLSDDLVPRPMLEHPLIPGRWRLWHRLARKKC
jgi:hypothetical protein